jgi:hypothetical protein
MQIQFAYNGLKTRHRYVTEAMREGVSKSRGLIVLPGQTTRPDVLVCYGWCPPADLFRSRGITVVTMDLAWYGRGGAKDPASYVKLSVNHWHPTAYFQNRPKPDDRWLRHGIPILPMRRDGRHIIVAGSGPKSSARDGNEFQAWEREAITTLRTLTDRPIIYRPKPYMEERPPAPIEGATMDRETPLGDMLERAHAVVTRQSNVAVDALRAGIPVFCWEGVASVLASQDLTEIERPRIPTGDERAQFFADLAYCQWTVDELRSGAAWAYMKDEGLIP